MDLSFHARLAKRTQAASDPVEASPIPQAFLNAAYNTQVAREWYEPEASNESESVTVSPVDGNPREQVAALYKEFHYALFAYFRSMKVTRDRAEEMVQEAFLRYTVHLVRGTKIENPRGWILRVAHNLVLDFRKKHASRLEASLESLGEQDGFLIDPIDPGASPELQCIEKELRHQLDDAVERMKPVQQSCFRLRMQGFGYKEIGIAVGLSTQRVALIVQSAIARLGVLGE
jgi:RNA polymerase sigma-70 factor, ECF subfamily